MYHLEEFVNDNPSLSFVICAAYWGWHASIPNAVPDKIENLNLQINHGLYYVSNDTDQKCYANHNTKFQRMEDIAQRDALQKKSDMSQRTLYMPFINMLIFGYMTFCVAKAGVKVASNRYCMWKTKELSEKNDILLERCEALPDEAKNELVTQNLASRDSDNNFSLHYICPISLRIMNRPVVVYIQKNNNHFELELYEKTSLLPYLQNKTKPLSPLTTRPLCMRDNQYWSEPNEEIMIDHANYIKRLTDFLDSWDKSSRIEPPK